MEKHAGKSGAYTTVCARFEPFFKVARGVSSFLKLGSNLIAAFQAHCPPPAPV
jgi:hypothetical protein